MQQIHNIIQTLTSEFTQDHFFENDELAELRLVIRDAADLTELKVGSALAIVSNRDKITLDLLVGDNTPVSIYSEIKDIARFVDAVKNELEYQDGQDVHLKITIHKKCTGNTLSVYSLPALVDFLINLTFFELVAFFARFLNKNEPLALDLFNDVSDLCTIYIKFLNTAELPITGTDLVANKQKRLDQIKSVSHYSNVATFKFIPEDFHLIRKSIDTRLNNIFEKLELLTVLTCLYDISENSATGLNYKLNGFKSLNGHAEFEKLPLTDAPQYYEIYEWVFEGGNLSDKIGLTRNILSLHLLRDDGVELKGNPFLSVKSGFEVYLKQNIKQYIEIRNKIADQLIDFNKRANLIIDTFAGGFQKSALATVTFFATVLVTKVLSQKDAANLFTNDAYYLTLVFIAVSIMYLILSVKEVNTQRERFAESYKNLKLRYTDLLLSGDIEKILNHDKEQKEDLAYIDQKKKLYTQFWIGVIAVIFIVSTLLYFFYISSKIFGPKTMLLPSLLIIFSFSY